MISSSCRATGDDHILVLHFILKHTCPELFRTPQHDTEVRAETHKSVLGERVMAYYSMMNTTSCGKSALQWIFFYDKK